MKASTRIGALAARASPGGRVLALLLALFVAASLVILVGSAVPSEAQTASTTYTVKDLGTLPGGTYSLAYGINDSGQVVGGATTSSGDRHAFLYGNGQMQDLGTLPGGYSSYAHGINDSGQVVGRAYTSSGTLAFLYSNGQMQDLNSLIPAGSGWILREAQGINTSGQIVGWGEINGQPRAFLATPDTPPSDTTPPRVSSTSPATATIAPSANVTATFTEAMDARTTDGDPSTINTTTFKLVKLNSDGTTTKVTAAVTYAAATKKAILNPATNLRSGRTYKATVTSGAEDLAGNALDQNPNLANNQPKSWKFTVQ